METSFSYPSVDLASFEDNTRAFYQRIRDVLRVTNNNVFGVDAVDLPVDVFMKSFYRLRPSQTSNQSQQTQLELFFLESLFHEWSRLYKNKENRIQQYRSTPLVAMVTFFDELNALKIRLSSLNVSSIIPQEQLSDNDIFSILQVQLFLIVANFYTILSFSMTVIESITHFKTYFESQKEGEISVHAYISKQLYNTISNFDSFIREFKKTHLIPPKDVLNKVDKLGFDYGRLISFNEKCIISYRAVEAYIEGKNKKPSNDNFVSRCLDISKAFSLIDVTLLFENNLFLTESRKAYEYSELQKLIQDPQRKARFMANCGSCDQKLSEDLEEIFSTQLTIKHAASSPSTRLECIIGNVPVENAKKIINGIYQKIFKRNPPNLLHETIEMIENHAPTLSCQPALPLGPALPAPVAGAGAGPVLPALPAPVARAGEVDSTQLIRKSLLGPPVPRGLPLPSSRQQRQPLTLRGVHQGALTYGQLSPIPESSSSPSTPSLNALEDQ